MKFTWSSSGSHRGIKSGWTWRLPFSPKLSLLARALQVPGYFLEKEPRAGLDAGCMASPCSKVTPAVFKSIPKSTVDANAASSPTQDCPVPVHQQAAGGHCQPHHSFPHPALALSRCWTGVTSSTYRPLSAPSLHLLLPGVKVDTGPARAELSGGVCFKVCCAQAINPTCPKPVCMNWPQMPQPLMTKGDHNTNNPTTITFPTKQYHNLFQTSSTTLPKLDYTPTSDMVLLACNLPDVNHFRFLTNKLNICPKTNLVETTITRITG